MAMDDLLDEGRTAFHTQMFGYHRGQVDEERARLERQLELVCADRDAALETAEDLTRHLEEARSELAEYRTIHAGHDKDNAVSGCIRYLLHVARRKADEIESQARARVEDALHRAEETAGRHARLLDEAEQETQRRLAEAGQRAREIVGEALERSRELLADLGERQRLLDQWYAEIGAPPVMPSPRRPELVEVGGTRGAEATPVEGSRHLEREPELDFGPRLDPDLRPEPGPRLDPDLGPEPGPGLDSDLGPHLDPDLGPSPDPGPERGHDLESDPAPRPEPEPDPAPRLEPELRLAPEPEPEPDEAPVSTAQMPSVPA